MHGRHKKYFKLQVHGRINIYSRPQGVHPWLGRKYLRSRIWSQSFAGHSGHMAEPCWLQPTGRPKTRWSDYISNLAWSRFGVEWTELSEVAVDREVFRVFLGMLPPRPSPEDKWARKWMNLKQKKFWRNLLNRTNFFAHQPVMHVDSASMKWQDYELWTSEDHGYINVFIESDAKLHTKVGHVL